MLNKPKKIDSKARELRSQFGVTTPRPGLLEWLSVPVIWVSRWLDILLLEKRKWERLPWKQRFRAWKYGFSCFSYRLYELEKNPPRDYVPDVAHMRFGYNINGRYTESIFSKVAFSRILTSLNAPQPPVLGIMLRGRFYPENGGSRKILDGLYELLEEGHKLVLRPSFGGGGTGIFFLSKTTQSYLINGMPANKKTLETLISPLDNYLVTGFVEQAAYAAEIAPESTNTLRILTLWDVEKDQPFMAATCHRFGRQGSGPLDNFHAGAGGTSVPIDTVSGALGLAVIREKGELKRLSHHPDTGKPIEGVVVPDWKTTSEELLALAARVPYAPCIGWDLVKQEKGWVCLEGNPFPGYHVWQVHGPILADPRARRFYRGIWNVKLSIGQTLAIDVVVLCLDRLQDTLECIDSVLAQDHPDVHLWVLDQGSEKTSIETIRLRAERSGFSFVAGKRTGVAAGRNTGYRMGKAPVIVALDNDAVLSDPGVLSRVSEKFAADEKLGALAFAVLDYTNGGADKGSWGYPWPVDTHLDKAFSAARFCGAGHAISRKAFEASPGYDEQLFFFGEELDLSWALIALGYVIHYAPDVSVRHKASQEQRIDWSNGRYYYNVRNMLYLTRKYFHRPMMLMSYMGGYMLKGIRNGLAGATIKGIWDGMRMKNPQPEKIKLSDEAYHYIMKYEFEPRGSVWTRFRREIVRALRRTGSA